MLTKEDNELLTRTDPGTPCGELMRRYWQPAALSRELPLGGAPLPVRLLGEDLVLFRDDQGRPGLLGLHCSHRGADLSYGRIEDGGLRCIYHGWLYDINGRCIEQPGEPRAVPSSDFRVSRDEPPLGTRNSEPETQPLRHPAYPCGERNGIIFAYLGPGDPPLLPSYPFFTVPENHTYATKIYSQCNYLQGNEGNIDLLHTSFLHYLKRDLRSLSAEERRAAVERYEAPEDLSGRGPSPGLENCEAEPIPYGLRICKIRRAGDDIYVRLATFLLPSLTVIPGGGVNWHVPIDDTHHWKYMFVFSREAPLDKAVIQRERSELTPDFRLLRNTSNRFMQDRESMETKTYTGMGHGFQAHDVFATSSQGAIQDRTQEHVVSSDKAIIAARKLLEKAIKDVQEGREPPHMMRDPALNRFPHLQVISDLVPGNVDVKQHTKSVEAEARARL